MLGLAGYMRFGWVVRDASMLLENKKEGEVGEREKDLRPDGQLPAGRKLKRL